MSLIKDPEWTETKILHRYADFKDKRVLEIGCGDGRLTWKYAREAKSVTAVDLEMPDLRLALIDRPADLNESAAFLCADSIHLPFRKEKFDLVVLAWSL